MTVTAGRRRGADRPVYVEAARAYTSAFVLLGALLIGFVIDMALGGGIAHLIGWLVAIVLVVGIDALTVHAARSLHTVVVTADEVRVGEHAVARSRVVSLEPGAAERVRVLGHSRGWAVPHRGDGLTLRCADGGALVIATRHPDRLAAALGMPLGIHDVRPADADELARLPEVEQAADALFRVSGIDIPPEWSTEDDLRAAKAVLVAGRPAVGVVRLEEVDGLAHIELLAVVPNRMRQGIGTALLDAACAWAAGHGYPAITLTTFADVAWNAPFYAKRGFVELAELTPELAEIRDWERAQGLDAAGRRIAMRRDLAAQAGS